MRGAGRRMTIMTMRALLAADGSTDSATRPEDVARAIGLSTDGVTSVLAMLASEDKVRITLVEPIGRSKAAAA
jgi:hypothetical protein